MGSSAVCCGCNRDNVIEHKDGKSKAKKKWKLGKK